MFDRPVEQRPQRSIRVRAAVNNPQHAVKIPGGGDRPVQRFLNVGDEEKAQPPQASQPQRARTPLEPGPLEDRPAVKIRQPERQQRHEQPDVEFPESRIEARRGEIDEQSAQRPAQRDHQVERSQPPCRRLDPHQLAVANHAAGQQRQR